MRFLRTLLTLSLAAMIFAAGYIVGSRCGDDGYRINIQPTFVFNFHKVTTVKVLSDIELNRDAPKPATAD